MARQLVLHSGSLGDLQAVIGSGDTDLVERLAGELPSDDPRSSVVLETARQVILHGDIYTPNQSTGQVNTVLAAVVTLLPHFSTLTTGLRLGAYWYLMELLAADMSCRPLYEHLNWLVGGRPIKRSTVSMTPSNGAICGYIMTVELPSFIVALRQVLDPEAEPKLASKIDHADLRELVERTSSAAAKAARDELDLLSFCL